MTTKKPPHEDVADPQDVEPASVPISRPEELDDLSGSELSQSRDHLSVKQSKLETLSRAFFQRVVEEDAPQFLSDMDFARELYEKISHVDFRFIGSQPRIPKELLLAALEAKSLRGVPFRLHCAYMVNDFGLEDLVVPTFDQQRGIFQPVFYRNRTDFFRSHDWYTFVLSSISIRKERREKVDEVFRSANELLLDTSLSFDETKAIVDGFVKKTSEWVHRTLKEQVIEGLPEKGAGEPMDDDEGLSELAVIFRRADKLAATSSRGRPAKGSEYIPKIEMKIRMEPELVEWLKAKGGKYQARLNGLLRALKEAEEELGPE